MSLELLGIFIYIFLQLLIGVLVSKRIATQADYLLAGRSLGYGLSTFTIFATWFGAETCIGSAGGVYKEGLSAGSSDPFGYALCLLFMGAVFAVPLWRRQLTTLADLFRQRYSVGVERLAVLLMVPTSLLWGAAQILAFGQVLSASSHFEVEAAAAIATAVVIAYTTFGGLRADAVTDFVQGLALILGLGLLLVIFLFQGGSGQGLAAVDPERLKLFGGGEASPWQVLEDWSIPIFGSVVAQELISRISASRSPAVARRSTFLAAGSYVLIGLIPVYLGLVGPSYLSGPVHEDQFLPTLAKSHLSPFFYVLFVGALVSAILSTVDSCLLVSSSLVSNNLIIPLKPGMPEAWKLRISRAGVVFFGILCYFLALNGDRIHDLVKQASSFGSAGLFMILAFGLFTRLGGSWSAFAALLAGTGSWAWMRYGMDFPYPYLASLAAALIAYLGVAVIEKLKEN